MNSSKSSNKTLMSCFVMVVMAIAMFFMFTGCFATKYEISVQTSENGVVVADKQSAKVGETVTLTVTPDVGYELDSLKVNGDSILNNTFVMPEENVVVTATFKLEDYSLSIPTEVVVKKDEIDLTNETILHYNDQISITYTTLAEGYYVTEFEVIGATQISENLYRVTGDVSINFAKDNHYTVTLSVANDLNYGTLDKSNVSVEYGAQVSFYAGILGIGDPSYILIGDTIVYPTTHTNTAQWVYFIEGYDIDGEYFSDHFVGMSKTTNVYDEMEIVVYFGREFQQYYVGISCNSAYGSLSSELDSNVSETGAKVQWGDFIEFDYTTNSISFYSVSEAQDLTFIIEPKESGSIEYDYVFKGWQIIVDTEVVEENPTSWRVEGEVDIVAIFETVYKP